MEYSRALIIFIKNPRLGKVKTRLAETLGDRRALDIYLELLKYTRDLAMEVEADRLLFYSNTIEEEDIWPKRHFRKLLQKGTDLGARMANAFQSTLTTYRKAIIIGSDCATLTPAIVERGFSALDQYDFVVGPATDGGYYLLGMRTFHPTLFSEMPWSTDTVLSETLKRIRHLPADYFLLPELSDIDYEEDWEKFGWDF